MFARNVTNEVHFYKADKLDVIDRKRVEKKLSHFSLAPSKVFKLVAFRILGEGEKLESDPIFKDECSNYRPFQYFIHNCS